MLSHDLLDNFMSNLLVSFSMSLVFFPLFLPLLKNMIKCLFIVQPCSQIFFFFLEIHFLNFQEFFLVLFFSVPS